MQNFVAISNIASPPVRLSSLVPLPFLRRGVRTGDVSVQRMLISQSIFWWLAVLGWHSVSQQTIKGQPVINYPLVFIRQDWTPQELEIFLNYLWLWRTRVRLRSEYLGKLQNIWSDPKTSNTQYLYIDYICISVSISVSIYLQSCSRYKISRNRLLLVVVELRAVSISLYWILTEMKGRVSDWSSAWLLQAPPPPGLQHCCSLPLSAAATTPTATSITLSTDIFMSWHNSHHISDI